LRFNFGEVDLERLEVHGHQFAPQVPAEWDILCV